MIELMMFLFIAGGQQKPAKAKPSPHTNPLVCVFAGKTIPCDRRFIPNMARTSDICKIKDAPNEPAPGVICIDGVRFEEAKVKPAPITASHKYYVTGYASIKDGGDCTHPALVGYGKSRVEALINAGVSPSLGAVTVWTASEYAKMRKDVGKDMDEACEQFRKKTANPGACADPGCTNHSPAMPSGEIFGHTEPTKDDPVTFYDYIQHPQHETGSYAEPIHPLATYYGQGGGANLAIPPYVVHVMAGGDPSLHASQMDSADGSKAVKISDSEYSHLQELRKAVADEEKRLAVKYGAVEESCGDLTATNLSSPTICDSGWVPADHFEYHGQFLLIEKVR